MKQKTSFRPLPWLICAGLAIAAFVLRFLLPGYGFSALVCCCLLGIIAFYDITRMLRDKFPKTIRVLRRVFTVCLAIGLLVVGITEAIIIRASFGNPEEPVDYVVVLGAKIRTPAPPPPCGTGSTGPMTICSPTRRSLPSSPAGRALTSPSPKPRPCTMNW